MQEKQGLTGEEIWGDVAYGTCVIPDHELSKYQQAGGKDFEVKEIISTSGYIVSSNEFGALIPVRKLPEHTIQIYIKSKNGHILGDFWKSFYQI